MFGISEPLIRLGVFASVFAAMALWEGTAPRRVRAFSRWQRWPNNLGIVAIDTLVVRIVFPTSAVAMALLASDRGWGLLNLFGFPTAASIVLSAILLDLAIYIQHVVFHAVGVLWRLHRMHHADLEFDVTTGVRFHPFEIVLSMAIKLGVIIALGAPAMAVLIFEVLLNASSMFNHSNVRISSGLERALRWFIVTPEMHRVHHSIIPAETNSNFGFNLPWWDWLFGTYRPQPIAGHKAMTIGIPEFREPAELRLDRMLLQPFRPD